MIQALALAIALAMDATAIAAIRGLAGNRRDALALPLLFGGFQAAMSALGWLAGRTIGPYIEAWDHWVASGLLVAIGGKMVLDAWRERREARGAGEAGGPEAGAAAPEARPSLLVDLGLAVATSIDAAAAGLTLPLLPVAPWLAIATIGLVTAACCAIGFAAGRVAGTKLGPSLTLVGGLLLIAMAASILREHL